MLADWLEQKQLPCTIKSNFGVDCPGCGTQRSLVALLRGDIIESIKFHPGVILFLITVLILILHLKFSFKNGAIIVMWSALTTLGVTLINYFLKLFHII